VLDQTSTSPPQPVLRLTDIASAVDGDWTRLARTLGVTECDIAHIRSTFAHVGEQALVMLTGWMTSRQRRHGNAAAASSPPGDELARALTCIRRDDVVDAHLADVIVKCPRRDPSTYADRGCVLSDFLRSSKCSPQYTAFHVDECIQWLMW